MKRQATPTDLPVPVPVPDPIAERRPLARRRDRERSLLVKARYHFAVAAFLSFGWLVLELAGQRENVAFLSGTLLDPEQVLFGTVYLLGWFAFVLVAPVFAIAGLATAASNWAARVSEPWARKGSATDRGVAEIRRRVEKPARDVELPRI